jgi:release factor glutamine methyltransferase
MTAGNSPATLAAALTAIRQQIHLHSETPGLDAQVLLAHICRRDKSWLLAHPEAALTPDQAAALEESLKQLLEGIPLPYVLGEWEFYGRRFKVTPDVLIPRPETELLVETALECLRAHPDRRRAAEAGAGSGIISISLAAEIPELKITATEISPPAASVARENVARYDLEGQITLLADDLLTHQPGPFDLIAANLPYIPTGTLHRLPIYQREPTLALDGGEGGLDLIERLLEQAAARLSPGGLALLEIESGQSQSASFLAKRIFPEAIIRVLPDLAGKPRLLRVQT